MSYEVTFSSVGRGKVSWKQTFEEIDADVMCRAVKGKAHLMSNDIDLAWDNEERHKGTVIVGGFRVVGTFEVTGVSA